MTDEHMSERLEANRQHATQLLDFVHLVTAEAEDQELALLTALTVHMERRYGAEAAGPVLTTLLAPTLDAWQGKGTEPGTSSLGPTTHALHTLALTKAPDRGMAASALMGAAVAVLEQDFGRERAVDLVRDMMRQALALAEPAGNA